MKRNDINVMVAIMKKRNESSIEESEISY